MVYLQVAQHTKYAGNGEFSQLTCYGSRAVGPEAVHADRSPLLHDMCSSNKLSSSAPEPACTPHQAFQPSLVVATIMQATQPFTNRRPRNSRT